MIVYLCPPDLVYKLSRFAELPTLLSDYYHWVVKIEVFTQLELAGPARSDLPPSAAVITIWTPDHILTTPESVITERGRLTEFKISLLHRAHLVHIFEQLRARLWELPYKGCSPTGRINHPHLKVIMAY